MRVCIAYTSFCRCALHCSLLLKACVAWHHLAPLICVLVYSITHASIMLLFVSTPSVDTFHKGFQQKLVSCHSLGYRMTIKPIRHSIYKSIVHEHLAVISSLLGILVPLLVAVAVAAAANTWLCCNPVCLPSSTLLVALPTFGVQWWVMIWCIVHDDTEPHSALSCIPNRGQA